jgi:hypothetical protein
LAERERRVDVESQRRLEGGVRRKWIMARKQGGAATTAGAPSVASMGAFSHGARSMGAPSIGRLSDAGSAACVNTGADKRRRASPQPPIGPPPPWPVRCASNGSSNVRRRSPARCTSTAEGVQRCDLESGEPRAKARAVEMLGVLQKDPRAMVAAGMAAGAALAQLTSLGVTSLGK